MFQIVKQLAKGTKAIVYKITLLRSDFKTTQKANKTLAKCRRTKHTRLQDGGTLIVEAVRVLIVEKESGSRSKSKEVEEGVRRRLGQRLVGAVDDAQSQGIMYEPVL